MQFTKLRLTGGNTVDLPIVGAQLNDTYIIKGVDGLGPVELIVTILNGVYQGTKPQDREIVMRIGLNPNHGLNQTAAQLRESLYSLLMPDYNATMAVEIMNGGLVVAKTEGFMKKLEIVPFAKDPEVQLTISCLGSFLKAPNELEIIPSSKAEFDVPNVGSAPTGFRMQVEFTATASQFVLVRNDDDRQMIHLTYDFIPGDILEIDTREGQKEVIVTRGVITDSIIGGMSSASIWPQLYPGANSFVPNTTAFDWGSVVFTPLYWGV